MARGFDVNQARLGAVAAFGKDLARRARSKCELCEASGVSLSAFEVPPAPSEPDIDRILLLCERCHEQAGDERKFEPGEHWRCLTQALWSELPAVQVLAVRLLRRQTDSQDWAREALEEVYLEPEVEAWATNE